MFYPFGVKPLLFYSISFGSHIRLQPLKQPAELVLEGSWTRVSKHCNLPCEHTNLETKFSLRPKPLKQEAVQQYSTLIHHQHCQREIKSQTDSADDLRDRSKAKHRQSKQVKALQAETKAKHWITCRRSSETCQFH